MAKMRNSIDYKETGRKWKLALWTAAAALMLTLTSCSNAQKDYESWETTEQLAKNDAKIKSLKDSYDYYYEEILRRQKNLVALDSVWDVAWAKREKERINELIETLKETEKEYDKASDKKVDLEKRHQDGKVASETEAAWWAWGVKVPNRRSFEETN